MLPQLTELELLDYLSTSYDKLVKLQQSLHDILPNSNPLMQKLQELKEAMCEQYMSIIATSRQN